MGEQEMSAGESACLLLLPGMGPLGSAGCAVESKAEDCGWPSSGHREEGLAHKHKAGRAEAGVDSAPEWRD